MAANDNLSKDVADAIEYLSTGGIGEVVIAAQMARDGGFNSILSTPDLTIALCILAQEALIARQLKSEQV